MTDSVNESVNYGGDCRTAPATPGLVNTVIPVANESKKIDAFRFFFTNKCSLYTRGGGTNPKNIWPGWF